MGTSSARPENLDAFARSSRAADHDLLGLSKPLGPEYNEFLSQTDWGYFDVRSLLGALGTYLDWNEVDARWVAQIAAAFRAAGGNGGLATLPDGAIAASLRAAGLDGDRKSVTFDDPVAFGFPPTTGYANDPVNTASGNFVELETDLGFGGLLAGLTFARTYNSRSDRSGPFGRGWASWASARLRATPDGAEYEGPDGQRATFPRQASGYGRVAGVGALVEPLAAGGLALAWFGGRRWQFDGAGLPVRIEHGPGTTVALRHDEGGRLVALEHAGAKRVELRWDGELVVAAQSSDGRRVDYEHDAAGDLVAVRHGGGTRRYGLDDARRIRSVADADGVVEVVNAYDAEGRVVQQRSPFGRTTHFAYLPGRVTVTGGGDDGPANGYVHDDAGRMLAILDGDDRRMSFNYDQWGNPVAITERGGAVTVQEFDERARVVRRVRPGGLEETFAYDDADRLVEVAAGGAATTLRYDGEERSPSEIVDPEGGVTRMIVADGLVSEVVDPDGVTVRFEFDGDGCVIASIDGEGGVQRVERDDAGRVLATVTPLGRRTAFVYDDRGLLARRRDPTGGEWRYEHTAAGRLARVTDPTGACEAQHFGDHGEPVTTVDPLGLRTTRSYDVFGNVVGVIAPGGATWEYGYDALMRQTSVTDPTGATWRREYDADGRLAASIDPAGVRCAATRDPAGRVTELADGLTSSAFEHDALGRAVAQVRPDGTRARCEYDRCGRRVSVEDPLGGITRTQYSPGGKLLREIAPSGRAESYEYDRCGRLAAWCDGAGRRTCYRYDADGALVERLDPSGEVLLLEYDDAGRVVAVSQPGHGTTRYSYDAAGRTISAADRVAGTRTFEHDAAGRLVAATDANGAVTRYAYDDAGHLAATVDPLGASTSRAHDACGRVVAETDPLGRTQTMAYDRAGRIVEQVDGSGRAVRWIYDSSGRVSSFGPAGAEPIAIERDLLGREVAITEPGSFVNELRWDRAGRLVERRRDDLAMRWSYGRDGERTAIGYPDGSRTTFEHDAGGLVSSQRHSASGEIAFERDAAGRLVGTRAEGMRATWRYEHGDLAAYHVEAAGKARTAELHRDGVGRVVEAIVDGGVHRFTHDAAGQLRSASSALGELRLSYDAAGRLTREDSEAGTRHATFDVAGQLVTRSEGADQAIASFEYDGAGRRIVERAAGFTRTWRWDDLGRLAVIKTAGPDTSRATAVAVDALGELAEVDGMALMWDSASPATPVAWLGDAAILGEGSPWARVSGRDATWLAPDWQGTIGDAPRDAWGATSVGSDMIALGYRGEIEFDGMQWLRNRVAEPTSRSFLAPDPRPPVPGTAWSANPYQYAANNPIGLSDPLGLRPVTDAELQEYRDGMNKNVWQKAGHLVADNWEYIAAAGMVAVGVGLMFTGVGGPAGIALMAGSGAMISAGASTALQKFTTGGVDWGQVAIAGAVGGAAGGLGAGAGMFIGNLGRVAQASPIMRGAIVGATSNVAGGAAARGLQGENPFDPDRMLVDLATGGGVGAVGGRLAGMTRGERTVDRILERPNVLESRNPTDVMRSMGDPPQGWREGTLGQGTHKGQGWSLREYTGQGDDTTGQLIRYHPGGGRHGPDPYWRVSSGSGGKSGQIPGSPWSP